MLVEMIFVLLAVPAVELFIAADDICHVVYHAVKLAGREVTQCDVGENLSVKVVTFTVVGVELDAPFRESRILALEGSL